MKRFILILFTGLIGFTSCTDHILNKQPLNTISGAGLWDDQSLMDAYLTQAWADTYVLDYEVNGNAIRNGRGWFQILYPNKMGLETTTNWGLNVRKFKSGGIGINGGIFRWWNQPYNIIRRLNKFIVKAQEGSSSDEFKKSRVAEARFLRAYNYFAMVKRYGGVPLITKVQELDDPQEELFPPRNKEAEVYSFIISEMEAILDDLPQHKANNNYGKPTKYAALALKCRAALYAGSIAQFGTVRLDGVVGIDQNKADSYYNKAYNAAKKIMDSGEFALYDKYPNDKVKNFRQLFLDKNNSEVIFAVVHNDINSQRGGNGWAWDWLETPPPNGVGAGNADGVYLEMAEAFEHKDGSSGKLDRSSITSGEWTTDELWKNKDPRFFASIYTENTSWKGRSLDLRDGILLPDGSIQRTGSYKGMLAKGQGQRKGGSGFGVLKYLDESHDNTIGWGTSETDRILFRYGEILLNYAEAAFELGKPDALDAINKIRRRAGIAELSSIDRDKIHHERKVELAFEDHRYWDVRRWRTAVDELSGSRSGLQYIEDYKTGKYKLNIIEDIDGTTNKPLFRKKNYYLPITKKRTETNPQLVENPGYE